MGIWWIFTKFVKPANFSFRKAKYVIKSKKGNKNV